MVELTTGALVTGPPKSLAGIRWVTIRPSYWPMSPSTWTTSPALLPKAWSSPARKVPSSAAATSRGSGARRSTQPGSSASTFTTCGIPAVLWPVRPGPACVNSWTGWGHSSTRAAYIYQHRTSLRDKMIADEISRRVEAEQTRLGAQRARGNKEPS